jgi:hypothetical protein
MDGSMCVYELPGWRHGVSMVELEGSSCCVMMCAVQASCGSSWVPLCMKGLPGMPLAGEVEPPNQPLGVLWYCLLCVVVEMVMLLRAPAVLNAALALLGEAACSRAYVLRYVGCCNSYVGCCCSTTALQLFGRCFCGMARKLGWVGVERSGACRSR